MSWWQENSESEDPDLYKKNQELQHTIRAVRKKDLLVMIEDVEVIANIGQKKRRKKRNGGGGVNK
jgi:hypothetical protein